MAEVPRIVREKAAQLSLAAVLALGGMGVGGYFLGRSQGHSACERSIGQNTRIIADYTLTKGQVDQLTGFGANIFFSINNISNGINGTGLPRILNALGSDSPRVVQVQVPFNPHNVFPNTAAIEEAADISALIQGWANNQTTLQLEAPTGIPANESYPQAPMTVEIDQPVCR